MNREIILYSDLPDQNQTDFDLLYNGSSSFDLVTFDILSADSERGSVNMKFIFRRKTDNKFFRLDATRWTPGPEFEVNDTLTEVFPESVTTIVYK